MVIIVTSKSSKGPKLRLRKWVIWALALLGVIIIGLTAYIVSKAIKPKDDKVNININGIELDNIGETVSNNIEKVETTVEIQLMDTAVESGTKFMVTAIVTPANTDQALVWSSSNSAIFEVDNNGIVTVKGAGIAVLTATVGNVSDAVVIEGINKVTDGSSNNLPIYNVSMNTGATNNQGNNGSSNNGGNSSGGNTSGGSTSGGNISGGSTTGGSSGGSTSGGNTSGGNTSGGSTSGGSTSGGSTSGGNTSGGNTSGGSASGGNTSGGSTSGGNTSGGSTSGGNTSGGNTSGGNTSGGNTSGGSISGGNTSGGSTSGGNTSGGNASGGNTSGGNTSNGGTSSGEQPEGLDSTQIGAQLPGMGFDQMVSNVYVCKEDGKYCGEIITQPNVTIIYVMNRSETFDTKIQSVLVALLPTEHSQVWTNYLSSMTDRTFTVEERMVRIVMPSAANGGHSQIVIYN